MNTPGLYEVFFDIKKKLPEVDIINGSGYSVVEGPYKANGKNFYWVERIER